MDSNLCDKMNRRNANSTKQEHKVLHEGQCYDQLGACRHKRTRKPSNSTNIDMASYVSMERNHCKQGRETDEKYVPHCICPANGPLSGDDINLVLCVRPLIDSVAFKCDMVIFFLCCLETGIIWITKLSG